MRKRLLVLTPGADQQNEAFLEAAAKLDLDIVFGSETPQGVPAKFRDSAIPLRFDDRDSVLGIVEYAMKQPLAAMVMVGDAPLSVASRASSMLGLPCHPPHAADAMSDPERLRAAGIVPSEQTDVTAEGSVDQGTLRVFALFDTRDDVLITPSRLGAEVQTALVNQLKSAVHSLGLRHGPVHARIALNGNEASISSLEARALRAPASRALRFRIPLVDSDISLEELIVRLMLGTDTSRIYREETASGYAKARHGKISRAIAVEGVEEIVHSPGPGYIFARGSTPEEVEKALEEAGAAIDTRRTKQESVKA
jgi:hypothetical protein